MRGLDCNDPSHGNMHLSAADDIELLQKVRQHIADSHPEMSEDDANDIVEQGARDE